MPTKDSTVLVCDHGIFIPIARRLARDFKKVWYWTPTERAFPTVADLIGDGFEDIERVTSPWSVRPDIVVFPDIGFSKLQDEFICQGVPTWGSRATDVFESSRGKFLDILKTTGLPVPPCTQIKGMTKLREHLRDKKDKFVKLSKFRKDWETLHWRDWEQDESTLDWHSVKLGPWKDHLTFFVFDPIDTEIEDGIDSYCIDGQWPSLVVHGMEAKDRAFLAAVQKFSDIPDEMRIVNEALSPVLKDYRNFFSTEVRITREGESFLIDPCCRAGSPPSQVMTELFENYADIIQEGAHGRMLEPVPAAQFGVQALLCAKGDRRAWTTLKIPQQLDQWVKCGFCSLIDGRLCFAPDYEASGTDIGWLCGIGDTAEEAIEHLKENVEMLPEGVTCEFSALADLLKEAKEAEKQGMEFSNQELPEPEIVL